jgi:hypothetical protein
MANFNYKRARKEVIVPILESLSTEMHNLYNITLKYTEEVRQNQRTLVLPWVEELVESPYNKEKKTLETCFEQADLKELAIASQAFYYAGHWCSADDTKYKYEIAGSYWKFAYYADYVLIEKVLKRDNKTPYCTSFKGTFGIEVHEGMLRVTFSNKDCWSWEEVGLCTEDNLSEIKRMLDLVKTTDDERYIQKIKRHMLERVDNKFEEQFLTVGEVYKETR